MDSAGREQHLQFPRFVHPRHFGAVEPGKLHRTDADAAPSANNQNLLPMLDIGLPKRMQGFQPTEDNRRGSLKGYMGRLSRQHPRHTRRFFRQAQVLRIGSHLKTGVPKNRVARL